MPVLPVTIPESKPVEPPMEATEGLLLVQRPPGVVLLNVVLPPWQTWNVPVIAEGIGLMVTCADTAQPVPPDAA